MTAAPPSGKRVSVVLPTLNERDNIEAIIGGVRLVLEDPEIIVVDDDSTDGTWQTVDAIAKRCPSIRLIRRNERGLTGAIKRGLREAHGDVVLWMDCDQSMPATTLPQLLEAIEAGADIAVGSRYMPGGRDARGPLLTSASLAINTVGRWVLGNAVHDYTSGFIGARRSVLDQLELRGEHGEYCIDLLANANRRGFRIIEVGYCLGPRRFGYSKTARSMADFIRNGWKYVRTIVRLARQPGDA